MPDVVIQVNRSMSKARRIVKDLLICSMMSLICYLRMARALRRSGKTTARIICDYIAGMTDEFAVEEHKTLLSVRT